MKEDSKDRWEIRLGLLGLALTLAGLIVGIWQFNAGENNRRLLDQEATLTRDRVEFKRRLWLERLEAYRKLAEVTGKIVSADNRKHREQFVRDFAALYWGTMILVEDQRVQKAMISYNLELRDYSTGWSDDERVRLRADELLSSCRASLEDEKPDPSMAPRSDGGTSGTVRSGGA